MSCNYNNSIVSSSVQSEYDHSLNMNKNASFKQSQQSSIPNHSANWGSGINSLPGTSSHQPAPKGDSLISQAISGHTSTEHTLDLAGFTSKRHSKGFTDVYEENEAEKFERVNIMWKGSNDIKPVGDIQQSAVGVFGESSGNRGDNQTPNVKERKLDPFAVWNSLDQEKQKENIEKYEKAKQELKIFIEKIAETEFCDLEMLSDELDEFLGKGIDKFTDVVSPHRCYFYLQIGSLYCRTKNPVKAQEYLNKVESDLDLVGKNENNGECYRILYLVKALAEIELENTENLRLSKILLRKFWDFPNKYLAKAAANYNDFYALILARYYLKLRKDEKALKSYADAQVLRKLSNKADKISDFEYLGWNEIERYLRQSKFLKKNK